MTSNVYPLPTAPESNTTTLCCATILGMAGEQFLLSDAQTPQAIPALSCLIEPVIGDTVLLARHTAQHPAYILAVLNRTAGQEGSVRLPGGSCLHDTGGQLHIHADHVRVAGKQGIDLSTQELNVTALTATTRIRRWTGWFDSMESYAVHVAITAKTLSSRVGRLWQRSVESLRHTEKLDETRAGRVKVAVDGHHRIQAQHISHTAQGMVKLDGQKIDLG